jgi:hypothetical protein
MQAIAQHCGFGDPEGMRRAVSARNRHAAVSALERLSIETQR